MFRGRSRASRQPWGSKNAALIASPRRFDASPRSCFGVNVMTSKLRYDIIIHNFHPFIFCMCLRPSKLHLFRCKLNVFGVCVLPHEFSLIHIHGFLTALPNCLASPLLSSALSMLMLPRPRENFLTHICHITDYISLTDEHWLNNIKWHTKDIPKIPWYESRATSPDI